MLSIQWDQQSKSMHVDCLNVNGWNKVQNTGSILALLHHSILYVHPINCQN